MTGPAAADRTSTSVTATGDVSATDNVFSSTRDTRASDVSFAVRPGVLFGYEGPRASHQLSLEGEVLEFMRHSDKPSVSVFGRAGTRIVTSRFTQFSFNLDGSNGVSTALSARQSPDITGPQLTPLGRIDTQQAGANMALSWDTGRRLQITPSAFARASRADDNADDNPEIEAPTIIQTAEAGGAVAIERSWRENALSLEAGASVLRLERDAPPTAMLGPRLDRQFNPRLRGSWRHDINKQWSSVIDGGAVYVHPFGKDPDNPDAVLKDGIFPVFGGSLAYTEVWGRASVNARREVAPNQLIAQNTINDTVTTQLALPLPWLDDTRRRQPRMVGLGSVGVARTKLIDSITSDPQQSFYAMLVDIGIGYSPRPGFTYGLRYQFQYQSGDSQAEMVIPGFWRNTLSFTFAIRYPDRANGDAARRRNRSTRADGNDMVPVGVDPVSTDLGAELGDDSGGGDE
jgi:hypothetical protein